MIRDLLQEAWDALKRNPTRSFLPMLGIVWGIATVTLLISYGNGFRFVLVQGFEAFGKSAVICWPGQTSEQAGGERAGKKIRFEQADVDVVRQEAPLVKHVCLETVNRPAIQYQERTASGRYEECAPNMARSAMKSRAKAAGSAARIIRNGGASR